MWRKIILALTAMTFVVACSSKKKDGEMDAIEVDGGVTEKPLGFDSMGSDSGNIPGLSTVHFEYDQFSLSPEARNILAQNAEWLRGNGNVNLQIEGHCDSRGSIEYNLTLGERRANAVKAYLVSLGIGENRLSVLSYGEEKPLNTGDNEAAHAANRRANFVPVQ
ncbi:MAG: peptidoglycan-associated lipoprotein Pal [Bdellovibrionales bacterium]|nr:peptidoglycan-associated lipoprotein Pal [Bdellovibrionales bacterium]